MSEAKILQIRDDALKAFKGKVDNYALGGGTALAFIYFQHRESYDLDFFTQAYLYEDIKGLVESVSVDLRREIKLQSTQQTPNRARVASYQVKGGLKIDFIEDTFRLYDAKEKFNDVPVLTKESIYLRKIYAACGIQEISSVTGQQIFVGGRQEAKDFFDLYYLSTTFLPISKFVKKFCESSERERVIVWHRRFDRTSMASGLLDIRTHHSPDIKAMSKHFDSEIEKIIREAAN